MHLRALKKYSNDLFLQEPIGVDKEGNEVTLEDKIPDKSYTIDEQVDIRMQIKLIKGCINSVLKQREKQIIDLRYGLSSGQEVTQREIADMLDISRSYVSRIEKKALMKLNKEINKK